MNIDAIIGELREERDQIDATIAALARLAHGKRRRGRPPHWLKADAGSALDRKEPARQQGAAAAHAPPKQPE